MNGLIYINSTLDVELRKNGGRAVSDLHYWGYKPTIQDIYLYHNSNRFEIKFRCYLGGTDSLTAAHTIFALIRGYNTIYLVTQPDLINLLPLFCKIRPNLKIITWVWTSREVKKWERSLELSSGIFCLTESAMVACQERNWSNKSYLQHIPVSPDYYYRDRFSNEFDVAIVGRTGRDRLTVERALSSSNFKWVTTEDTNSWLKIGGAFSDGYGERKYISPRYQSDVIDVLDRPHSKSLSSGRFKVLRHGRTSLWLAGFGF